MKKDNNQISIDFIPRRKESKLNYSMFIEDLIISKYSLRENSINILIESKDNSKVENFLKNELSNNNIEVWYERENLEKTIFNLVEKFSYQLVINGHCIIEKNYQIEDSKLSNLKIIKGEIKYNKNNVKQYIPNDFLKYSNGEKKIIIPREKCYILEFPKSICSKKEYIKILENIENIEKIQPMYSIMNPTKLNEVKGYDPIKHHKKLEKLLRKATRKISWHHREQFSSENYSYYYVILRNLKFKRTKLILLNHILRFIKFIIEDLFEDTNIELDFHKTIEDLDIIINEYEKGNFNKELQHKMIIEYSF